MKKIVTMLLVGSLALTGCDLFGSDDDGTASTDSGVEASFGSVSQDTIFNISGEFQGAFDLVAGERKSASEGDGKKDLIDNGELEDGTFSDDFSAQFTTGNMSAFVELDLASGASESDILEAVQAAATNDAVSFSTETLVAGDRIAVVSGQTSMDNSDDFYLVTIVEVVSDADSQLGETPAKNEGFIVFDYQLVDVDESTTSAQ
jgi:hypothetical protein